jgi:CDP-paratose 2-epimerase
MTLGRRPRHRFEPWRTADQRYYVSDTTRFQRATGWSPRVSICEGLERLSAWLRDSGTARSRLEEHRVAS